MRAILYSTRTKRSYPDRQGGFAAISLFTLWWWQGPCVALAEAIVALHFSETSPTLI